MQRNEQAQLLRAAKYLLYLWQQNRAELAATSSGKPVKPQDSKEESMEGAGARLDWKIETHCIARGGGGFTSRQAQALERGANCTAAKVRYDRKFERGDIGEFDTVFLNFSHRRRRAEIPLLADDFAKPLRARRGPSQDELLCSSGFVFLENQRDSCDGLRLIE